MNMQQATEIVSEAVGMLEPEVAEAIAHIVSGWSDKCDALFLEKERLREALEFYGDYRTYLGEMNGMFSRYPSPIEHDEGEKARKVLEVHGE